MKIPLGQYRDLLVSYLQPQWPSVALLSALLFGGIALQLVNPLVLRYFVDAATSAGGHDTLTSAAMLFLGVALVAQTASILVTYVGEAVSWTATNKLRADLTLHCLRLDMTFHNTHTPGEMIERVDGDVTALGNFFSSFVSLVLGNLLLLGGILVILFVHDWRVGLALTLFAGLTLLIVNRLRDLALPYRTAYLQARADVVGFVEERLGGIGDIRVCGAPSYVMQRLFELMRERYHRLRGIVRIASLSFGITFGLFELGTVLGLALGAYLFRAGSLTVGTIVMIFYYVQLLRTPLIQFVNQMEDLQKVDASVARVAELARLQPNIQDGPGAVLPLGPLSVEFRDVSFGYGDDEPVLHDLSFELKPGEVLGLLGRTGSGKTSIARLLARLYDPNTGTIRLGGVDLRVLRLADLRRHVGVVTQDVQLFHASVRDNLTLFNRRVPDEAIRHVLEEVGLSEWFRSLPQGLDTELRTAGAGLSAGEAQLRAFARVFLRNPGLVILDEASSRLDPATEGLIERAIAKLLHDRTGIVIAHRLETVQRADKIIILEDGRIAECGERTRLAADPRSRFHHLLRRGLGEVVA